MNKTSNNNSFYCLGAAHFDVKSYAEVMPKIGESIPVKSTTCLGGVACNVAVNLAKCGAHVKLYSLLGNDKDGYKIIDILKKNNILTHDISFSKYSPTARYQVLLSGGKLFIALAEMNIYEEFCAKKIYDIITQEKNTLNYVVDANIPSTVLQVLSGCNKDHKIRLWAVGVSSYKIKNLLPIISSLQGLVINCDELKALTNLNNIEHAMRMVHKAGCSLIIATAGSRGVYFFDGYVFDFQKASPLSLVDVTGAGDAFSAGAIFYLTQGHTLKEAVIFGMALAQKVLLVRESSLLTPEF